MYLEYADNVHKTTRNPLLREAPALLETSVEALLWAQGWWWKTLLWNWAFRCQWKNKILEEQMPGRWHQKWICLQLKGKYDPSRKDFSVSQQVLTCGFPKPFAKGIYLSNSILQKGEYLYLFVALRYRIWLETIRNSKYHEKGAVRGQLTNRVLVHVHFTVGPISPSNHLWSCPQSWMGQKAEEGGMCPFLPARLSWSKNFLPWVFLVLMP